MTVSPQGEWIEIGCFSTHPFRPVTVSPQGEWIEMRGEWHRDEILDDGLPARGVD